MQFITHLRFACACALALILTVGLISAQAQTTAFSYQGKLDDAGSPANGAYDFEFRLFDASSAGTQIGSTITVNDLTVTAGIFNTSLDFGASAFPGANRWLEISVRLGTSTGAYTTLTPRQPINSTPYAVRSLSALTADTATNATNATTATNFNGALGGDVTGTQSATVVGKLQGKTVAPTAPTNNQVLKFNGTTNQWEPALDANSGGTITGVTPGTGLAGGGTSGNVSVAIAAGGVGSTELATNSVTTAKITDGNVTTAKLADSGVTNAKISDVAGGKITGSITTATISGANVSGAVANATNATTSTNFSGLLGGDVTGTQSATIVGKLQGRTVAGTAPASGQVLKFNGAQWEPATDNTGSVTAPLALTASNAAPIISGANTGTGSGVKGEAGGTITRQDVAGVIGFSSNENGNGIIGEASNGAAAYGVWGISETGSGVVGENLNTVRLGASPGVRGIGNAEDGVWASSATGNGIYASGGNYAAYLAGKVYIGGPLEKPAGSFKIDHPLDPENKYLYHSFVESPDMKNIYDGVVTLGEDGSATVELPEWFSALNGNFRYQLTAVGAPGPNLHIAEKLSNNQFKIAGGNAGMEVSWQVTGIRQDAYANKHRIQVEVEKAPQDRGTYLHPEAFDQPEEKGADWKQRAAELDRKSVV